MQLTGICEDCIVARWMKNPSKIEQNVNAYLWNITCRHNRTNDTGGMMDACQFSVNCAWMIVRVFGFVFNLAHKDKTSKGHHKPGKNQ